MGIDRALLSMALAGCLLAAGAADSFAARQSCLQCHRPHYQAWGSCVSCHRGDPRSDRRDIAHHHLVPARFAWFAMPETEPVQRGKKLLETFSCRRCHKTAGKGNGLASNLDRLPAGGAPQELFEAMRKPARLMPQFRFDERQLTDLVNAVMAGAGETGPKGREVPKLVHFEAEKPDRENVFEKRCGPCHKLLSGGLGGVGRGSIGPNLSGFLTGHYPATAPGESRWTAAALGKWLKNPRQSRDGARMRPVPLEKEEFERLLAVFGARP